MSYGMRGHDFLSANIYGSSLREHGGVVPLVIGDIRYLDVSLQSSPQFSMEVGYLGV